MTTDELRTWMKALEERDVRIVSLEKRLAALEAFAQPPRMFVREDDTGLRRWLTEQRTIESERGWREAGPYQAKAAAEQAFAQRMQHILDNSPKPRPAEYWAGTDAQRDQMLTCFAHALEDSINIDEMMSYVDHVWPQIVSGTATVTQQREAPTVRRLTQALTWLQKQGFPR